MKWGSRGKGPIFKTIEIGFFPYILILVDPRPDSPPGLLAMYNAILKTLLDYPIILIMYKQVNACDVIDNMLLLWLALMFSC